MLERANSIEVNHLVKAYGDHVVLNDVTLSVPPGGVLAVVGPPGSGKTTLARILATAEAPTRGVVRILGYHVRREALKARVQLGYMPARGGLDLDLTVEEYLTFFLRAYDRHDANGMTTMADVLELADLTDRRRDPIAQLRPAEGRKLSLARCLLHDPRVLILDEPLAELDAGGRDEVRAVLGALREMGKSLVVCTRSVDAMAGLAREYCLLDRGVACEVGEEDEIRRWAGPQLLCELQLVGDVRVAVGILERAEALILLQRNTRIRFALEHPGKLSEIEAQLREAGLRGERRTVEPTFTDVVATYYARRARADRTARDALREVES